MPVRIRQRFAQDIRTAHVPYEYMDIRLGGSLDFEGVVDGLIFGGLGNLHCTRKNDFKRMIVCNGLAGIVGDTGHNDVGTGGERGCTRPF